MRFKQIVETTTAGSVATVAQPMMTQTRENTNVRGLKPVQQVIKGKAAKKGPYANSIVESKVTEDDLAEQDLIVIPGQGRLRRTGFVKHDLDQGEHEGQTLKNSLHTIARAASDLDKRLSTQSEFPEWVSEKIGAAKGMMVTVMDYLISSQEMQHDRDAMESAGVIAGGLAYEDSDGGEQIPQMAMGELRNIAKNCKQIHQMLKQGNQLDAWEYSYITVANDHIGTVADVLATDSAEDVTEGSQRVDSLVTDALRVMKGPEVSDAVLALKRVLGDRAYNERRGFYSFYIDQIVDMYGQQGVAEGTEQQWTVTVGTKTGGTSHTMTFSGTKEQAIKKAVARFGTSKNPVVNAVPAKQGVAEGENWSKHNNPRAGGMSKKSVSSYRRSHPGSKIQTAVTTKPSKLKKGSKSAKRRASFCARMRGMKKHRTGAKTAHDPNSNINKSLRRWHCESIEELHELVMLAEQFIRNNKK